MTGYAIFVTCMWVIWIVENGYKARKIRQYAEVTTTQAKRIRHLESLIKLKDETIQNLDDACVVYQGMNSHEDLGEIRGPKVNLNS